MPGVYTLDSINKQVSCDGDGYIEIIKRTDASGSFNEIYDTLVNSGINSPSDSSFLMPI